MSRQSMAYVFGAGELEALIAGLPIERNALSPVSPDARSTEALTAEQLKLRENDAFITAATIMLSPQIKISAAKGGGSLGIQRFSILGRLEGKGAKWTVFLSSEDAAAAVFFSDTAGLIEWFNDTFAVMTETPMNNFITSNMTLEEWVVIAHAMDAFRRAHMESMLLYKPCREYSIGADDFISSLDVSLESGDIRWLLPAFLAVTPVFPGLKPDLKPDALQAAERYGLVSHAINPETGDGIYRFTTEGMTLGLEFATSWMYAVGLDAEVLNGDGVKPAPACFLAPTSLGNHLFTSEKTEGGSVVVSHNMLTHTELDMALNEWINKITENAADIIDRKPETVQPAAPEVMQETQKDAPVIAASIEPKPSYGHSKPEGKSEQIQTPGAKFCMKCGSKVNPGVRFCSKCGNKVA